MAEPFLLGIDIGTSSAKGVLATADGSVIATAVRPCTLSLPRPGWAEQDAETVWWAAIAGLARELAPRAEELAAVCVSGIGPCLLPTDAAARPLRPAILYGIDTRATREVDELTQLLGPETILHRGGSALSSQAVGPKLLWLRRHEPAVWAETRRFFMASSFAVERLTGAYVLDHHSASQCDPLYDLGRAAWALDWAEEIVPGLELPPLVWAHEVVGRVTSEAAAATAIPAGTPVCAGTIDAWAEAHSVGVRACGDFMLMYGTTIFMIDVSEVPVPDQRLWLTNGCLPESVTRAAGLATSGALTAWLREIAGGIPYEELLAEAGSTPPGSERLVVLPYFAGERSPIHDPDASGVVAGLTLRHGRGHLYRALLEATAYAVRHTLEVFEEVAPGSRRIVPVGGGVSGELWLQIVSDVTGRTQEVPAVTVGACYGDALLAAQAVGLAPLDASWFESARRVRPDPSRRPVYDELYAIYRDLYPATAAIQHRLASARTERDATVSPDEDDTTGQASPHQTAPIASSTRGGIQ